MGNSQLGFQIKHHQVPTGIRQWDASSIMVTIHPEARRTYTIVPWTPAWLVFLADPPPAYPEAPWYTNVYPIMVASILERQFIFTRIPRVCSTARVQRQIPISVVCTAAEPGLELEVPSLGSTALLEFRDE